ncbi:MAG: hypothetical protein GC186_12080 [Rhodobacteraceae bacterium]|nr:hypothetical protein [Paracoccaceae bacterium]
MNDTSHQSATAARIQPQVPGPVWAFHARRGQPVVPLAPQDISSALAAPDGWVWLHFDLVDRRAPAWVIETCALPKACQATFEAYDFGLALAHDDGTVHGITADMQMEFGRGVSDDVGRMHFALKERLLVTGRHHPLEAVEEIHAALIGGAPAPSTAFELFEALQTAFCRNTSSRLAAASKRLDEIEDHLVADNLADERKHLKTVRRLAVSLHRPISGIVSLFDDEDRISWPLAASAHDVLRRLAARFERLDREVVMINDRARLLQEEISTELQEESNRSLKVLTIISALLLPGTVVAGIFGMNTGGLPFATEPWGFVAAIAVGVGATVFFYWLLIKAGANMKF